MELESVGQKISKAMQGNQNARPAHRLISDTLRMIAVQNPKRLRTICDKMMTKAEDDVLAFREIADRIEGKVALQIQSNTTVTVIDADLLREAGYLLSQIGTTLPPPIEIVDPEPSEEVETGHDKARKRYEVHKRRKDRQVKVDATP